MTSREIEKIILKKMKELKPSFNIYILNDLKEIRETKRPRIVSNTYLVQTLNTFNKNTNNGVFVQYEEQEHTIRFNFVLNDKLSFEDVNEIRSFFNHEQGVRYWLKLNGYPLVIKNITKIENLTQNRNNELVERYSFDIDVKVINEYQANIDTINKVEFKATQGGKQW